MLAALQQARGCALLTRRILPCASPVLLPSLGPEDNRARTLYHPAIPVKICVTVSFVK